MKSSLRIVVAIILFHVTTAVTAAAVVVHAELDDDRNDVIASGDDNNVEVIVSAVIEEGDDDVSVSHSSLSLDNDAQYHDPDESSAPLTSSPVDENSIANNQHYIHLETYASNDGTDNDKPPQQHTQQKEFQYTPPTYYQIAAHIQTNLHTGISYFVPLNDTFAHLPFLECGVTVGSTTERLPLVSGVFRHVPHNTLIPKRNESMIQKTTIIDSVDILLNEEDKENNRVNETSSIVDNDDDDDDDDESAATAGSNNGIDDNNYPKRPSPPKYVVALSSMEITLGGGNGSMTNETQKFVAGDVIFIEDSWWGVWDDDVAVDEKLNDDYIPTGTEQRVDDVVVDKMKGFVMRASSEKETDLNVLMLTVPDAVHRHWKNAHIARRDEERDAQEEQDKRRQSSTTTFNTDIGTRRSWWSRPSSILHTRRRSSNINKQSLFLKPCNLETDPIYAHPSSMSSATTLSQHFMQHFTNLLRRLTNPVILPNSSFFVPSQAQQQYYHHQDNNMLMHILAQTTAATIGGMTAFTLVLHLWKIIPSPTAVAFGSVCFVVLGTWSIVWLGEEISDQWLLWRERRRLG
jgi:hypothetical protein